MDGPQHVQATGPGYASDPEMCFHSRRNVTHPTSTQPVHLQLLLQLPVVSDRKSQLCREQDLQGAWVNTGGNLGTVKTRLLSYTYACNSSYSGCQYQEVFSPGAERRALRLEVLDGAEWQLGAEAGVSHQQFQSVGQSTPYFACPNTYQ